MSKFIQKAIKHPGSLHRALGIPQGEKIPEKKLKAAEKKGGKIAKKARFAEELKGFNHHSTGYKGKDSREGRLHNVKTSHGEFRFKDNRKGE